MRFYRSDEFKFSIFVFIRNYYTVLSGFNGQLFVFNCGQEMLKSIGSMRNLWSINRFYIKGFNYFIQTTYTASGWVDTQLLLFVSLNNLQR